MKMLVVDAMVGIAVDELYMDELLVYINMLEIRITWWYHCQGGGGSQSRFSTFQSLLQTQKTKPQFVLHVK